MYVCFVYTCIIKKKRSGEKKEKKKEKKEKKENLETWLLFPYYRFSSISLKSYYRLKHIMASTIFKRNFFINRGIAF